MTDILKKYEESDLSKTMLSCADKAGVIVNNFKDIGKAFRSIPLLDKVQKELLGDESLAAMSIKNAIQKRYPYIQIIKTLQDQINDGWKGLSKELTKQVLDF